jgi:hypothetical protein
MPACCVFLWGAGAAAGWRTLGASSSLLRDAKTDDGGLIAQDGNAKQMTARPKSRTIPFLPEWLAAPRRKKARTACEACHNGLR